MERTARQRTRAIAAKVENETPKSECNSRESSLQTRMGKWIGDRMSAWWAMTGMEVAQQRRFPMARLRRRGVQWLWRRLVLWITTTVKPLPKVPEKHSGNTYCWFKLRHKKTKG